ncbi:MAG: ferredoxin--nitrite reductase [Synechococcus sp.]|nr:ferredoxin--nitrite reductase [Synechococcus sp.]
MAQSRDLFSRLVNWFTSSGTDKAPISRPAHQRDVFSKLMNKISG